MLLLVSLFVRDSNVYLCIGDNDESASSPAIFLDDGKTIVRCHPWYAYMTLVTSMQTHRHSRSSTDHGANDASTELF